MLFVVFEKRVGNIGKLQIVRVQEISYGVYRSDISRSRSELPDHTLLIDHLTFIPHRNILCGVLFPPQLIDMGFYQTARIGDRFIDLPDILAFVPRQKLYLLFFLVEQLGYYAYARRNHPPASPVNQLHDERVLSAL